MGRKVKRIIENFDSWRGQRKGKAESRKEKGEIQKERNPCEHFHCRRQRFYSLRYFLGNDDTSVVTHLLVLGHSTLLFLGLFRPPFQLSSVNRIPYTLFLQHLYISYRGLPTLSVHAPRMRRVHYSGTRFAIIIVEWGGQELPK